MCWLNENQYSTTVSDGDLWHGVREIVMDSEQSVYQTTRLVADDELDGQPVQIFNSCEMWTYGQPCWPVLDMP